MIAKRSFCTYKFIKIGCTLCLIIMLLLQFAGCNYGTKPNAPNAKETADETIQNSENTGTESADEKTQ